MVIPMEYPTVRTRLIDVDTEPATAEVVAELRRPATTRTVALRRGRRWALGYEVVQPAPTGAVLRERGVYLITGGLGGIGLAMAERLARDCSAGAGCRRGPGGRGSPQAPSRSRTASAPGSAAC